MTFKFHFTQETPQENDDVFDIVVYRNV